MERLHEEGFTLLQHRKNHAHRFTPNVESKRCNNGRAPVSPDEKRDRFHCSLGFETGRPHSSSVVESAARRPECSRKSPKTQTVRTKHRSVTKAPNWWMEGSCNVTKANGGIVKEYQKKNDDPQP